MDSSSPTTSVADNDIRKKRRILSPSTPTPTLAPAPVGAASPPASAFTRMAPSASAGKVAREGNSHSSRGSSANSNSKPVEDGEKQYFDSYAQLGIHEAMLRDTVRTEAYYNAIMQHRQYFENRVVIDVGCGTGILSLFCAWAGARQVYAIEASTLAGHATNVVKENHQSHIISVIHGKVEDITLVDEVTGRAVVADVIVSEWMGYCLFYESMLESVLLARDRWLSPDGVMFPSHAVLFMCPLTDDQYYGDRVYFWNALYGASMTCLADYARQCSFENVIIDTVHPFQCFANTEVVKFVDCKHCELREIQQWTATFEFKSMIVTNFHGFVLYFSVFFYPDDGSTAYGNTTAAAELVPREDGGQLPLSPISQRLFQALQRHETAFLSSIPTLSTAPEHAPTHWQQTLLFTGDQLLMVQDQRMEGRIDVCQNKDNKRFLDITLHWTLCEAPPLTPWEIAQGVATTAAAAATTATTTLPTVTSIPSFSPSSSSSTPPCFFSPSTPSTSTPPPPIPPPGLTSSTNGSSHQHLHHHFLQQPQLPQQLVVQPLSPLPVLPPTSPMIGYGYDYGGYSGYGHGFGYNPYSGITPPLANGVATAAEVAAGGGGPLSPSGQPLPAMYPGVYQLSQPDIQNQFEAVNPPLPTSTSTTTTTSPTSSTTYQHSKSFGFK